MGRNVLQGWLAPSPTPSARPPAPAPYLCHGYNKDHRPDCKQIVFGLNVTADGHVPLLAQWYDGNRSDVTTHQTNWQALRQLLGRSDFIYVADSKLCAQDNLDRIAEHGGQFITIMPRNFKPVTAFLEQIREGTDIPWQQQLSRPNPRKKGDEQHYRLFQAPQPWQGHRIVWVHSESKAALERGNRDRTLDKAEQALTELAGKLGRHRLKSRQAIEKAVDKALGSAHPYIDAQLSEHHRSERVKVGPGRPGPNSRYETREHVTFELHWQRNDRAIAAARRTDGLFPLLHNTDLSPEEVFLAYKDQPHLEKRFSAGKTVLQVAPVFLKNNRRIEAMLLIWFVALMLLSLIERKIRAQMHEHNIEALPIRIQGSRPRTSSTPLRISPSTSALSQRSSSATPAHQAARAGSQRSPLRTSATMLVSMRKLTARHRARNRAGVRDRFPRAAQRRAAP
ncbi:MAG: IS1634 family transposase [Gammaproteobacteria bacterium]|nr:IS1634 family transposase [Gammaproteobacteria bacterium]